MSRSINIWYTDESGKQVDIEVRPPYDLLGTQGASKLFWGNPRLKEIGITRLSDLGVSDPVMFGGWDDITVLEGEIGLLREHFETIEFAVESKAAWLSHLTYCCYLLKGKTPRTCSPQMSIG